MRIIRIMTAALLAAGFGIASARADSISFSGSEFPSFAEVIAAPVAGAGFGDDANVSLAQTFTVTNAFSAGAIYLAYETDTNGPTNDWSMTVRMFAVTNVHATFLVAEGPDLYTGTFTFPNNGGADATATILLDTLVPLSASVGTAGYAIQITEAGGGDFNPGWEWLRPSSSGIYAGGDGYEDGEVKGTGTSERDFTLAISSPPPPQANDDEYILLGITSTNVAAPGVLANDVAYDSAVLVTNISSGSLTFNADGSFDCSGLSNGSNTFSYAAVGGSVTSAPATVLLTVVLSEDPPDAVDDTYVMDLAYGDHIEGNVLNNDTNNSVVFEMFAMEDDYTVANGTLTVATNDSGAFFYTPDGGFTGTNSFTYKAYTQTGTSTVATVTLIVESSTAPGIVIDSFETYDNSTTVDVQDIPDAALNWNAFGSGQIEIRNSNGYGPSYQHMKFGWSSGRYRGAISTPTLFSGIPNSSTEYWLYCELYPTTVTIDGNFGVTDNPLTTVATAVRGDFSAGVRFSSDGVSNINLYAFTGGGDTNDVLLTTGLTEDIWYGVWLNINNAANTYDVFLGEAGDASNLGAPVGINIAFDAGTADLNNLLVSSTATIFINDIMNVDPDSFIINLPANLYDSSLAAFDTMQLSIGLNKRANASDYWPVSSDDLVVGDWGPVAHSDAPDGTFAVTSLDVASGDETNKVIYVKTTDTVEFFRIENNQ